MVEKMKSSQSGITLLEMAIALLVVGLFMSAGMHFYGNWKNDRIYRDDLRLRERVTSALAFFVEANGRYPCPANRTLTPDHDDFGKEMTTCGTSGAPVTQGAVPVHALNLPYYLAADVYHRKFTYAVTTQMARPGGLSAPPRIVVMGQPQMVAFVLVSHGPDGRGAVPLMASTPIPCTGTALDTMNCDGDDVFRDYPFSPMAGSNHPNHFDDRLVYSLTTRESSVWVSQSAPDGRMLITNKNDANVGIGVTIPEAKLHVRGEMRVDSSTGTAPVEVTATGRIVAESGSDPSAGHINVDDSVHAADDVRGDKVRANIFYYD